MWDWMAYVYRRNVTDVYEIEAAVVEEMTRQ